MTDIRGTPAAFLLQDRDMLPVFSDCGSREYRRCRQRRGFPDAEERGGTMTGIRAKVLSYLLAGALAVLSAFPAGAQEGAESVTEGASLQEDAEDYTLEQVVILSRHNIRSPLSAKGSAISDLTPHEWFDWTSEPGELSLRGAMLETTMGQYFRLWLEDEGLFPVNYLPKDGAVRFYANGLQRTQATAHYFSAGLLPAAPAQVERHVEFNELDGTFLPLIRFFSEDYEEDVREEIYERGGGDGLSGYREKLDDAFDLIVDVTDMADSEAYQSGAYGDILEDETSLVLEQGKEPALSGPIKTMISFADALVLQYYEEPDDQKAAFGHELTEDDWRTIGSVLGASEDILFTSPLLSVNLSCPMLRELYAELNAQGRQFSFLCGHDSTIASVLAALGTELYTLPGAIEPATPIGSKLVFERWQDEEGRNYYKVNLVYQSTEQLRRVELLSPENPPMIFPLSFAGVAADENGMMAEDDLLALFEEKIDSFRELEEVYSEEEQELAA